MSEQFIFDQAFGDRGAVQRHKRLRAARRKVMHRARKKLLARSALTKEQHRRVCRGHALHLLRGFLHGFMFADNARESVSFGIFLPQQQILAQQFLLLRRALHQQVQVLQVHRLLNEVIRAFLHRGHGLFDRAVRGDQNDGNRGIGLFCLAQHVQTGTSGQLQVSKNQQISPRAHFRDG